ncbi:MAG TPA: cytochrome c biogenesis protein DipZ [Gaiellaceae bacterium]
MIVLIGIGLLAGIVTAISPCVLPVLPILFAGGASGGRRRPYAILAGLVATFTLSVLVAAWVLSSLGLPEDLLRNVSIGLLFLVAATLMVPRLGELLERPFQFMTRRPSGDLGGGFLLGASLGFVFVPCAGPVLGAVSALAARHRIGGDTVIVTLAYAVGAAIPMLIVATGGRRAMERTAVLRAHAVGVRRALGVVVAATAVAIVFHAPEHLQTALGDYTNAIQRHTEATGYAAKKLQRLNRSSSKSSKEASASAAGLHDFGPAPNFAGISAWLNTPDEHPLTLARLRGRVVLVDFWTYSCINCLRTLPYLEAWDKRYRADGLTIVGVHTPEFAFEHVLSNVRDAVKRLGVRYPVGLDNDYATWDSYSNQYWPAEYLIDAQGHVREVHFGEGNYDETEEAIRTLLAERQPRLPKALAMPDHTPFELMTPESYLGYERLMRYQGTPIVNDHWHTYEFASSLGESQLSYAGQWNVGAQRIVSGANAKLRLQFRASDVYIVLGGHGTVRALVDGKPQRTLDVTSDRLYTVTSSPRSRTGLLELRFSPGVQAYSFTFG